MCGLSFRSEIARQRHLSAAHSPAQVVNYESYPQPTVPCSRCDRVLQSRFQLYEHLQQCNRPESVADAKLTCTECDRVFLCKNSLRLHTRSAHTQASQRTCEVCHKVFATKQVLKDHRRIHEGTKPFICHFCGAVFRCRSLLSQHLNCVHGKSKYACIHCDKTFSRSNYLTVHLKRHDIKWQRQLDCDKCDNHFRNYNDFKKHSNNCPEADETRAGMNGLSKGMGETLEELV